MFTKNYFKKYCKNLFNYCHKISKRLSRYNLIKFLKSDLKTFIDLEEQIHVLFVGSGGPLEELIRNTLKCKLITIDVNKERNPDYVMSITEMDFKDNNFNLVLMLEVLEHVDNPFNAPDEIFRVLKPGGTLLLSTPFILGIHDAPFDYWRFTKYGLKEMFSQFENIIIKERTGFFLTICNLLVRLIISETLFLKILGCLFSLIVYIFLPLINLIDYIMPKVISSGYFLKATKKSL